MKVQPIYWNQRTFVFRCGRSFCHVGLYESLTNVLELKDFRFSLWQFFLPCMLYEKAASKATSAEPPPRWAIGTGQLSCLQFRSGPIARRGGGGIIPFGSASTTLYLLCPAGHARLYERVGDPNILSSFVVGEPRPPMRSARGSYMDDMTAEIRPWSVDFGLL